MTIHDAVLVIDRLQHRHDCVGGAGRRRYNFVVSRDLAMVDAMNDVLQLALARRSQHNTGNTRALEVLAETLGVAPFTGVVDQQSVFDTVLGVIHRSRIVRIDHLNQVAIGSDGVVFGVDVDGAFERTMDRIAAQQAGALDQIVISPLAHDNGTQTQAIAAARLFNQDAGEQATDTTETIEHDVGALVDAGGVALASDFSQLVTHELVKAATVPLGLELPHDFTQVHRSGTQVHLAHGGKNLMSFIDAQLGFVSLTVTRKAMCFEQCDDRTVDQPTAIDGSHHVVVTIQLTNQRNHRFGEGFSINPFTKTLVGLLSHGQFLPTCRG